MSVFRCLASPVEFCSLALVDTWRFSKAHDHLIKKLLEKAVEAPSPKLFNPILNKFYGNYRCETGDAPFRE